MKEIGSAEKPIEKTKGEVNEVGLSDAGLGESERADRLRAINTVGPKEIARALEMKETEMSKRGMGYVAESGGSIENYGEKKIMDNTDGGENREC